MEKISTEDLKDLCFKLKSIKQELKREIKEIEDELRVRNENV